MELFCVIPFFGNGLSSFFPLGQRLKRTWKWVESGGRFFLAGLKYDSEALLGYEKMKNGIGLLRGRSGTLDTNCHWLFPKIRNLPIRSMKASNPWPNLSSRKGDLFVPFRRMQALWFVLDTCEAFEYREIQQMIDWNLTHKSTHTLKLTQFYLHFLDALLALKFESSF